MREEINYRMIPNKMNLHAGSEKRMRNAGVVEPESQEVSRQATNLGVEMSCQRKSWIQKITGTSGRTNQQQHVWICMV